MRENLPKENRLYQVLAFQTTDAPGICSQSSYFDLDDEEEQRTRWIRVRPGHFSFLVSQIRTGCRSTGSVGRGPEEAVSKESESEKREL